MEKRENSLAKKTTQDKPTDRLIAQFNFNPFLPKLIPILKKDFNTKVFQEARIKAYIQGCPQGCIEAAP